MATSADAEQALASLLWDALQPMVQTTAVSAFRGWPESEALDAAMNAGTVVVSVHRLEMSRNTTRFLGEQSSFSIVPPSLTASVSNTTATFSGTADLNQVAGVIAGGVAYAVRTGAGDTPAAVAGRLAALIPPPVQVGGASLTAPALSDARTAHDASSYREVGRQENTLQADFWCPTPDLRDQAEKLALPAVADATFLTMPDGSVARFRLGAVLANDQASPLTIYRLMLRVTAEVVLSVAEQAAIVLWPQMMLGGLLSAPAGSDTSLVASPSVVVQTSSDPAQQYSMVYTQPTPSTTWTIPHNLGHFPSVTVLDTAGEQIEPGISYPDFNTVVLTFSAPVAGTAYLV